MSRNSGTGNGSFIFGLILGAIGGAAAALFTTPKSGNALRHDIETKINETTAPVREKAEPLLNQGKERATGFLDTAAHRAQDISGKIAAMDLPFDDDDREDHAPAGTVPPVGLDPNRPAT